MADLSDAQTAGLLAGYGLSAPPLAPATFEHLTAYFRTLGLCDSHATPKPAAHQLALEACARDWIVCPADG